MAIERVTLPSFNRLSEDRFQLSGSVALPRCVRFLQAAMLHAICGLLAGSIANADESPTGIADGTLHACAMLDIDRAIAVGERGLILRTEDGGKSWISSGLRGSHTYFGIGFDATGGVGDISRSGLIVGGRIDLVSGRSEGIVELTVDEGKTWSRNIVVGLPRLLGLQQIAHRHWIAWGDWSDHWQSSLFETTDGGKTWNARPTPSGHLRCASVDSLGRTMIIDRTGAVFFSNDGIEFQPSPLVIDPFRPLRFCKPSPEGWWVGGDSGQLFFSEDGSRWSRVLLPGTPADHSHIQIRDAAVRGSQIWLLGMPGAVVWHSVDSGRNWAVGSTQNPAGYHAIHAFDDNILLACGELGRIQLSRNGGDAWIDCHRGGSRVACQAIASTERTIPWDLLAFITHESQRRASAIVVHQQDFQGGKGHRPEVHERVAEAGRQMGLERVLVLTEFPVGELRSGIRSTDLAYYQPPDPSQNELIRRLVLEIRCARPDVIVAEDTTSKHSLTSATAVATQQAIRLAASPAFQCFSPESGIVIPEWNAQRVLLRGNEAGGLSFAPTLLLNSSGMLLSEAMQPARYLELYRSDDYKPTAGRATYRIPNQRTATIKHPMDGMILDRDTRLLEGRMMKRKMSSLVAAANVPARSSQLLSARGSGVWIEHAWDDALSELGKELSNDVLIPNLRGMALDSRRAGNWHRWNSALNMIIERDGEGAMAALAYQELMTFFGSAEVHRLIQDQWIAIEAAKKDTAQSTSVASSPQASPFATANPIALASFDPVARATPIAKLRGLETFARLLGRWPDSWQPRRTEPEWAWLIASRFRSRALLRGTSPSEMKDNIYWPPHHPGGSSWNQILEQEQRLLASQEIAPPSKRIPWIDTRPFLDGKADENIWRQASVLNLSSLWSDESTATRILIARDAEFLFIHSQSRKSQQTSGNSSKNRTTDHKNQRRRDALDSEKDHIRFRMDLDRDYATWYELAWDIDGETLDQCNDMPWWNPEWFIAVAEDRETWSAEIAIPMASLLPLRSEEFTAITRQAPDAVATASKTHDRAGDVDAIRWEAQTWAMSFAREIPSCSLQSLPMGESDRWSRDQWFLAFPQPSPPLPPEQSARVLDSTAGFPPARR